MQEQIFNKAYQNYSSLLLKIIKGYVKEPEECQDILQEVFYTLLVKNPKFKSAEHERYWLIRVAINKSKDYHKTFWKRMVDYLELYTLKDGYAKEKNLAEMLEELPGKYKEVMLFYYQFGYTINEIAKRLKLSESAVKMRLSRARSQLKIEMEEE